MPKVKNNEQIKALVDFLEYLFLIQDPELEKKFSDYKKELGGAIKMTVDEIRKLYYEQKGREQGIEQGRKEAILDLLSDLGEVDKTLKNKIEIQNDIAILKQWNKAAAKSDSIEEFLEKILVDESKIHN